LVEVQNRINKVCTKSNRNPDEIKLLLATKTISAERIKIALQAGHRLISENKLQELKEKYEALKEIPHTNHFLYSICKLINCRKQDTSKHE